jgi:hypothetical protein
MPLIEFIRAFREFVPARFHDEWNRDRIVSELNECGFKLGLDSDKRHHVAGLALRGTWTIDPQGKMVLKQAAERMQWNPKKAHAY